MMTFAHTRASHFRHFVVSAPVLRLAVLLAAFLLLFAFTGFHGGLVEAHDPHLRLPWPGNESHDITTENCTYGCGYHTGTSYYAVDFNLTTGNTVNAVQGGIVVVSEPNDPDRGQYIEIDHGNSFISRYAHLSYREVVTGTRVYQGQFIGRSGCTGRLCTGPHLHFVMNYVNSAYMPEPMSNVTGFGNYGPGRGNGGPWTSNPPTSILLNNPSFEGSGSGCNLDYWEHTPGTNFVPITGGAMDGNCYARANRGTVPAGQDATIWQDWPPDSDWSQFNQSYTFLKHPDAWTFGLWARSNDQTTIYGRIVIWAMSPDGQNELGQTNFTLSGSGWKLIQATVYPTRSNPSHMRIRVQIYMDTANHNYDFDASANLRNYINNTSWEGDANHFFDNWGVTCGSIQRYRGFTGPTDDSQYLETNPDGCGGTPSIYQDYDHYPTSGDIYHFRLWIRSPNGTAATGTVVLWKRRASDGQWFGNGTNWSISANDTSWHEWQVDLYIESNVYDRLKAELYMATGWYNLDYDGARFWGGPGGN